MFSLATVTFYCKKILQLTICGFFCYLSYWENINSHLSTYNGYIDNKFKLLVCQAWNNMETTLHVNDYKFHKPGK